MYSALICFSFYFSYVDLKSHRISNKAILFALILFSIFTALQSGSIHPASTLIVLLFAPLFLKLKVGAGDIKLFALLSAFFLPHSFDMAVDFVSAFSAISALLIVITTFRERTMQSSIALAPAICGAFIWCAS
jgi:Flp pilus assembly protein protease CpaA